MATKDQIRLKRRKAFWAAANSPLAIILISGGAMAGIAKLYNDRQVEAADLETRRTAYVELLAEYQHRVSFLMDADAELNGYIGEGLKFTRGKQLSENGPDRRKWERVSEEVGQKEHNILRATGDYVPTTPVFARVDLLTLAARIERTGGIPDIQLERFPISMHHSLLRRSSWRILWG